MDATVKKIVQLLGDERIERRCAAAMVLAELRVKEPEVLEALGGCLTEDNPVLQRYVLEALAGVRSPRIARYVAPLLDSADEEIRVQATALLADQGTRAAAALAKELQSAPISRRRAIVTILARNHDGETIDRLLALLPDAELGEYTLNSLRGEIEHSSADESEDLRGRVTALLKNKTSLADATGTARALRLLGYLRDPKLARTILPFASEKNPVPVRLAALAALRRPLQAGLSEDAIVALLRYADDSDATLARAAVDTLHGLQLPESVTGVLTQLAEGRHAEARKFALEALGRSGSNKVVRSLLAHLAGDDPVARDTAARSLAKLDGVGQALAKELEASLVDTERLRLLCRLMRGQIDSLPTASRKSIAALASAALEDATPAAEPLLELLAAIDADAYRSLLVGRAAALRKAKRFDEAFAVLRRLEGALGLDDEGRYLALVCGLCALPSKKELGRASRTTDPVLRLLVDLIAAGDNVAARLKKEKCLTPDDLFYIGFNFSESKDEDEKDFGGQLLGHLASTAPRSKLGRSAKNKLHLVGLDE
jgi:hypothetical protein